MLVKQLTGHMYRGSIEETDSDCGNCDGARCEYCTELYSYYGYESTSGWHSSQEEALALGKAEEQKRLLLVPGANSKDLIDIMWILKDEKLCAYFYKSGSYNSGLILEGKYVTVECNEESPLYYSLWKTAVDNHARWCSCPITDKGKEYHISYCQMFEQCEHLHCIRFGRYNM